jgi:hypothetical protein
MEEAGIDGRIILKWILRKYGMKISTGLIWFIISLSDRFS